MPISVEQIAQTLEEVAPKRLAEEWDNVGLLLGSPNQKVEKVLLSLDVTPEVVEYATAHNFGLIVSHHPMIFRPLKTLREDLAQGSLVAALVRAGISVYCAHTNWDMAESGTSHQLARALQMRDCTVLEVKGHLKLYKLVVFVPDSHLDVVFEAMCRAGAGQIGNYAKCSFRVEGTGTFVPLADSNPYIGKQGHLEKLNETRLEMIVSEANLKKAVRSMLRAHPYEEAAYDMYELHNSGPEYGLGKLGVLTQHMPVEDFLSTLKSVFPSLRVCGVLPNVVKKVAVCGGAGAELFRVAKSRGADVLITGDVSYHVALDAAMQGMAIVDVGHYETEVFILDEWEHLLRERLESQAANVHVAVFKTASGPFLTLEA